MISDEAFSCNKATQMNNAQQQSRRHKCWQATNINLVLMQKEFLLPFLLSALLEFCHNCGFDFRDPVIK